MSECKCKKVPTFHPKLKTPFAVKGGHTQKEGEKLINYFTERGFKNSLQWYGTSVNAYYGIKSDGEIDCFQIKCLFLQLYPQGTVYSFKEFEDIINSPEEDVCAGKCDEKKVQEKVNKWVSTAAICVPEGCSVTVTAIDKQQEQKKSIIKEIVDTTKNFGLVTPLQRFKSFEEKMIEDFRKEMEQYKKDFEKFIPYQVCPNCKGAKNIYTETILAGPGGWNGLNYGTCNICNGAGVIPMHKIKQ